MPIRAVVFDLFDTLVDLRFETLPRLEHAGRKLPASTRALHEALAGRCAVDFDVFAATLSEVDRGFRRRQYEEGREVPTQERMAALLGRIGLDDADLALELTGIHMRVLRGAVSVPEHHAEVLGRLAERVRLGLCSNFTHSETALGVLEEAGLLPRLGAVAISDRVGWRKPRREIFEAVLRELRVAPEETLHVGDNLAADVAGAARLGLRTAWITRRVPDVDATLRAHSGPLPEFRIHDLGELLALLERDAADSGVPGASASDDSRAGLGDTRGGSQGLRRRA